MLITEVPEFCGAEHILAHRAKDRATGQAVYEMVDWYKDYAAKFGTVLGENPSPGQRRGRTAEHHDQVARRHRQGRHDARRRVLRLRGAAAGGQGLWLMQGPGYDQESTPGLVGAGAQVVVFTTGRGTTIGNAIAPVVKLASNSRCSQRMSRDLDLSAGGIIDGTESIDRLAAACSITSSAWPRARCSRWPKRASTGSSASGPSSRFHSDTRRLRASGDRR